ncbi:MAG: hypothetical protein AAF713_13415 [Pseudomonadota bacterium]
MQTKMLIDCKADATIRHRAFVEADRDWAQPTQVSVKAAFHDRLVAPVAEALAQIRIGAPKEEGTESGAIMGATGREPAATWPRRGRLGRGYRAGDADVEPPALWHDPSEHPRDALCRDAWGGDERLPDRRRHFGLSAEHQDLGPAWDDGPLRRCVCARMR